MEKEVASQVVTLSLLQFNGWASRWWMFTQMGLAYSSLAASTGLRFGRLLGSGGGNGFALRPNFGVYAWLGVWENTQAATLFFEQHPWWQKALSRSQEQATLWLVPTMVHGQWAGQQPFTIHQAYDPKQPTAVLTRATIRTRKLLDFWRYVPSTSAAIHQQPERLLSLGIGEYPVFMQATFSLWRSGKAMQDFAYQQQDHREVVRLTRERKWYKEELFARFSLLKIEGKWVGLSE